MTKREKIFVDGMISKDIPDTTPDFILGKGGFNVDTLITFLNNHKEYAIDGWLNYAILRSKGGKRYVELDLYQYDQKQAKEEKGYVSDLSPEDIKTIQEARQKEIDSQQTEIDVLPEEQPPF